MLDVSEKFSGTIIFFNDLTKRKKAENKLSQEKKKLQKYLDISEVMFLVLDTNGKIKSINKKGCEILGYKQEELIGKDWFDEFTGHFGFQSGRAKNKFEDIDYDYGIRETGLPILEEHTIGYIEAEVIEHVEVETHIIFICHILNAELFNDKEPLTYAYYHDVKNGKTPELAPSYVKDELKDEDSKFDKYECGVCGYVYNPKQGDLDSSIPSGTTFVDLPDNWECPICGSSKDKFKIIH
jgi:rubredoxin